MRNSLFTNYVLFRNQNIIRSFILLMVFIFLFKFLSPFSLVLLGALVPIRRAHVLCHGKDLNDVIMSILLKFEACGLGCFFSSFLSINAIFFFFFLFFYFFLAKVISVTIDSYGENLFFFFFPKFLLQIQLIMNPFQDTNSKFSCINLT